MKLKFLKRLILSSEPDLGDGLQFLYYQDEKGFLKSIDSAFEVVVRLHMINYKRKESFTEFEKLFQETKIDTSYILNKEIFNLKTGENVYMLKIHYSDNDVYSTHYRYVIYSDRAKKRFTYNISFKSYDSSYSFEETFRTDAFAKRIINYFTID